MVKEWCNSGSTWDYILRAEAGKKSRSAEENEKLIALMCGIGINATNKPEPKKLQLSKEAAEECVNAVNGTTMIPHPTVDDQRKCIFCRPAVALHMVMPNNLDKEKRYELNYCNSCMLVVEEKGVIFIDNLASCGCPAVRYRGVLDCKSCYRKKGQ
jgi:hypothetical protein